MAPNHDHFQGLGNHHLLGGTKTMSIIPPVRVMVSPLAMLLAILPEALVPGEIAASCDHSELLAGSCLSGSMAVGQPQQKASILREQQQSYNCGSPATSTRGSQLLGSWFSGVYQH